MKVAVDFDGTLVDGKGEWLPGAREALKTLRRRGHTIIVYSARANYDGGREQIAAKLATAGCRDVAVYPKPVADIYIDDRAVEFTGDWRAALCLIRIR